MAIFLRTIRPFTEEPFFAFVWGLPQHCDGWGEYLKRKSLWVMRWVGPGIVIGHEGDPSVWTSYRKTVVKASNHVRGAELEEQVLWHDLYDSLAEANKHHDDIIRHDVAEQFARATRCFSSSPATHARPNSARRAIGHARSDIATA